MARVDRADGHRGLPPRERTVKIHLVCGALPEPLNGSAIAAYLRRETVKAQALTSKKPEEWQQLMDRVQNVCEACETELCLDLSEDQALEQLRDHVRNCDEDDEFMCNVKYIADVPLNATEFRQVMARVDRADGHRGLPPRERTVKIHLVCGALPEPLNGSAIAAYLRRETVKAQALTSKKPEEWQQLMDRVQNVCEACETELCLDLSEDQALEQLRDHVRNCDEDDEFMCNVKKEKEALWAPVPGPRTP